MAAPASAVFWAWLLLILVVLWFLGMLGGHAGPAYYH